MSYTAIQPHGVPCDDAHDTLMTMWRPPPPGPRIGGGMCSVPAVPNHSTAMACTAILPHVVPCAGTARHAHGDVSTAATRTAHRGRDGAAHSFSGTFPAWNYHRWRPRLDFPQAKVLCLLPSQPGIPQAGDFEPPGFATGEFKICSSPPRLDLPQARVPGPVDTLRNPRWNHHLVSQPGLTTGWGLLHPPCLGLPQVGAPPGFAPGGGF